MTEQSKELTAFYKSYLDWLDAGAPEGRPYRRRFGLCSSIVRDFDYTPVDGSIKYGMIDQFIEANLNKLHPFNNSFSDFFNESNHHKCHLNEKRIQWVRDHAYG